MRFSSTEDAPLAHTRGLFHDAAEGQVATSGIPLLALFDFGATYSFVSCSCVVKLKLYVSFINKDLVVEIPTSGCVLTSNVCLNCPVEIFCRTFLIDLICLPLNQIDVLMGMDWLSSNHVLLNYFDKTMMFDDS